MSYFGVLWENTKRSNAINVQSKCVQIILKDTNKHVERHSWKKSLMSHLLDFIFTFKSEKSYKKQTQRLLKLQNIIDSICKGVK